LEKILSETAKSKNSAEELQKNPLDDKNSLKKGA
jgi:hypothetical protein